MLITNLRISRKLTLAFLAVVTTIVVMSGAALWNLTRIGDAQRDAEKSERVTLVALQARMAITRVENSFRGWLLSNNDYYLGRIDKHEGTLRQSLAELKELEADNPTAVELIDQAEKAATIWRKDVVEEGKKLASDPLTKPYALAMVAPDGTADRLIAPIEDALESLIADEAKKSQALTAALQGNIGEARAALVTGLGIAMLISVALGFMLTRMIAKPIDRLTAAMGRLASGDNETEIPAIGRRDEIGQMAAAVQVFKEAQIAKVRLEAEAVDSRTATEAERARTQAEKEREAAEDRIAVAAIATGLARLAEGDLTYRIAEDFPPKAEQLKTDFNRAMVELQAAMTTIHGSVGAIGTGTGEITQAADDLSRRTEQQAASLEQTAAALTEVSETVRQTADGARQAARVTGEARAGAEKSSEVVREAITAMAEIERSSEQISQIIGVIDEIAFQTNLLALNAGVEAARAGEAGKGFAVVASEVRALAQRSAEAAKEIKSLISMSTQQVEQGVDLVGQTGSVLEQIASQVTEMSTLVGEIAASAQEQSTALGEVTVAINQMDQVTQQNAAMVEQSTAASHSLAGEADQLARLVAKFRLGIEAAPAASRPLARPQQAQRTVTALKTMPTGYGSAALAAQSAPDDWEEF
ncbi:methyl-accepting chemotaxis protein [Mesorhizobium sp. 1B3]|uniref:methyl-accepting chemotaxis protein n=1 Tax=Mesorhizobium sp. 1B3 TaxID=3243599 RepID=UPI003D98B4B2